MEKVVAGLLILVGVIHLMPLAGLFGAERLASLYGIAVDKPDLLILMQHRAVLFGLLGLFLVLAAFKPALQPLALVAGFISVVSFLAIAGLVGGYNDAVRKVVVVDIIALVALCMASGLHIANRLGS